MDPHGFKCKLLMKPHKKMGVLHQLSPIHIMLLMYILQIDDDNDGVMSEPVPDVPLGSITIIVKSIESTTGETPGISNMVRHVCVFPGK